MLTQTRSPIMVGRDRELARLEALLLAAVRGEGRVAVITGEAGAGKSRLAAEVMQRARTLRMLALRGECSESDLSLPYRPLADAFGQHLVDEAARAQVHAALGEDVTALTRVLPQLRGGDRFDATGTSLDTLRLFESALSLIRVLSAPSGLVLLIEDIHWVDRATQELLEHLVRRLQSSAALLLLTMRESDVGRDHPLRPALARWERGGVESVRLQPLSVDDVATMAAAILDVDATPSEIARRLHERSDGLPFAVEELLRQAIEHGGMAGVARGGWATGTLEALPPPRTLTDGILVRTGRLAREQLEALRCAAVLGRSFDFAALQHMTAVPAETLIDAVDACVAMQLIEEDRTRDNGYRFRHILIREAVYNDIIVSRRRLLHSRAAESLRATRPDDPAELAHHLMAAGRTEEAASACAETAALALRRLAPQEATELFAQALRHTTDARERARLECGLGEAWHLAGDVVRAQQHLEAGVAALEDLGDAAVAAHHRLTLGRCCWVRSQHAEAQRQYERARSTLEEQGPSEDLALAYIRLSGLRSFELDAAEATRLAERAIAVADECGSIEQGVAATDWLGLAMCHAGALERGRMELQRSAEQARVRNLPITESRALIHEMSVLETYGMVGALPAVLERLNAIADDPWSRAVLPYYESWLALWSAELREAARAARRCVDVATGFGMEGQAAWGKGVLCLVATELGDLEAAAALLPRSDYPLQRQERLEQGWVALRYDLAAGAWDDPLRAASDLAAEPWAIAGTALTDTVVEALLRGERVAEAGALIERIAAHPRAAMHQGHLLRARGRLALAVGDSRGAFELLRNAAAQFSDGGYRLEVMRSRVLLGEAQAAAGDRDGARRTIEGAAREAQAAAAGLIARAAEAAARRAGIDIEAALATRVELTLGDVQPITTLPGGASEAAGSGTPAANDVEHLGTREVTVLIADVRARSEAASSLPDPVAALRRWASLAVEQHHGVLDEYAGDVVMATFNAAPRQSDHARHALEAALELVRTGERLGHAVAAGVATGPAVIGCVRSDGRFTVLGEAATVAARLQAEAGGGDILMSETTHQAVGETMPPGLGEPLPCAIAIAGRESPLAALRCAIAQPAQRGPRPPEPPPAGGDSHVVREGEFWSVAYAGKVVRLKDSKGLRDLVRLLSSPGTEIAAVDLAGVATPVSAGHGRAAAELDLAVEGDVGDVLDERARSEYRQRLIDLEAELADAEDANDPERASRVRQERDFIIDELGAAVGLRGKSRRALDPTERARKAVTWRLRDTIGRIETAHPELGRHLRHSVRTGTFCVYDPVTPTRWSTGV